MEQKISIVKWVSGEGWTEDVEGRGFSVPVRSSSSYSFHVFMCLSFSCLPLP